MTPPAFVDRETELETLRSRFRSDRAELVIVYGRRRLGKSALVREGIDEFGTDTFEEVVEPTFSEYMGPVFETVCQNALPTLIPKMYHRIGSWWHREHELDVVGFLTPRCPRLDPVLDRTPPGRALRSTRGGPVVRPPRP